MKKAIQFIIIGIFCAWLLLPLIFFNKVNGDYSQEEKRRLAGFPAVFTEDGTVNPDFRSGFEAWLNDNIGFRSSWVSLYAKTKLNVFNTSSSDQVQKGKDGWFFYTPDHNLEIAFGEYPLTAEMLEDIGKKQQAISDYYQSIGKDYILVLTPSKVSIYPEKIASGNYSVTATPVDMVEKYLKENTTVKVINVKNALLEAKGGEKLYLKTDTHWTQYGTYTVYGEIVRQMNEWGLIDSDPVSVQWGETLYQGEFAAMLGSTNVLPEETVPDALWEHSSVKTETGEYYEKIKKINGANKESKGYDTVILENSKINSGKTLLIYGDSQWRDVRKLPDLLAEHFSKVVNMRFRSVSLALDSAVNPDVVLFACSERFIDSVLTRELTIPASAVDSAVVDSLPVRKDPVRDYRYGNRGIFLDKVNGVKPDNVKGIFTLDPAAEEVTVSGWAGDFETLCPLAALYVRVGDQLLPCEYGAARTSVSNYFKAETLLNTGFSVTFSRELLQQAGNRIEFILVGTSGTYRYAPVEYRLGQ